MKPRGMYLHTNGNEVTEIKLGWLATTIVGSLIATVMGGFTIGLAAMVKDHYQTQDNTREIIRLDTELRDRVKWGESEHRDIRNEMRAYELKSDHQRDVDQLRSMMRRDHQ